MKRLFMLDSARTNGLRMIRDRFSFFSICLGLQLCIGVIISPSFVAAHPDLPDQIQAVTEQIFLEPNDAKLYLKRGELYRHHRDWNAALKDYEAAEKLDPTMSHVELARGSMWLDAGRPKFAELSLNGFLAKNPEHAKALMIHGRVLAKLGRSCAAADDFTHAGELLPNPIPDFYLERARALASCGEEHIDVAIDGLDSGMERLGALVALQTFAIDLELSRHRYNAALTRLEHIERQSARKENWLLRKGEILVRAGRNDESREAFRLALAAIQSLPERHRTTKWTRDLETRLQALLTKTDSK